MASGWAGFWSDQHDAFNSIMKINTEFFAHQLQKKFLATPGMQILDYGCGPGLMADVFARNSVFTGVDINDSFIRQCQVKHPESKFLRISEDLSASKIILDKHIRPNQFDIVVVLSIIQYFPAFTQVEALLALLREYTKANGKVILADVIDDDSKSWMDAGSLFVHAIRKNKLPSFIKFIQYLLTSDYRELSRTRKLLTVSQRDINQAATKFGFNLEVMKGMTIHPSRRNYILTKTT
jgi:2-polyprenyl-3-methyl-5-hydroxy-6-metoxy-1,4-benzoquinol methylase